MNYTTEDAINLWKQVQNDIREHAPQVAYDNACEGNDPELMAMTLVLTVQSAYPLSR